MTYRVRGYAAPSATGVLDLLHFDRRTYRCDAPGKGTKLAGLSVED